MTKVIATDLKPRERNRRAQGAKLSSRLVRQPDGTLETVYLLDTENADFGDQFLKVFQLNVNRARRRRARPPIAAE